MSLLYATAHDLNEMAEQAHPVSEKPLEALASTIDDTMWVDEDTGPYYSDRVSHSDPDVLDRSKASNAPRFHLESLSVMHAFSVSQKWWTRRTRLGFGPRKIVPSPKRIHLRSRSASASELRAAFSLGPSSRHSVD